MTGLETAIILIAFVTVAAVFGYAVLSAGLFASEREKETIYAGLQQAKANMEVVGSVIAYGDTADPPTKVAKILFTVRNAIAGSPIDMTPNRGGRENRCVISLTTAAAYDNNVKWIAQFVGNHDDDQLLEAGEQLEITLDMADLGAGFGDPAIGPNAIFNIQVKPTQGSTMTIQRTLPAAIDPVMDLDLMTGSGGNGAVGGGGGGGSAQQRISVSTTGLGFGSVPAGASSSQQGVTVSNTGTANLSVGTITVGGANPNQFAIASDTASNQTIASGASRIVNITFNPTSTGTKLAILSIPSNDPVNNPVTVAMSGTGGTPPGGGLELVPCEMMTADIINGCVFRFTVSVELVSGGNPIDMSDSGAIVFGITTPAEGSVNNLSWVSNKVVGDGDNLLEPSEWYDVRVDLSGFPALHSDDTFTLSATPAGGSTYPFQIKLFHFPSNFTGTVSFNNNYGL